MADTNNIVLGTHYADCWRSRSHHACAVARVEQLQTEVERLRCELHNERVRRDEWEKMYQQAIAGTEVERLREHLEHWKHISLKVAQMERSKQLAEVERLLKTALDSEVDSRVRAELEAELMHARAEVERLQAELARARQDAQDQSNEVQELWLSPCEAEGLKRQLQELHEECDSLNDRTDDAMGQIHKYDEHLADNLIQYAVEDVLERLVVAEQELKQRQRQIDLLSGAELRVHQAGRRTENLQQEKVGIHEVLDECQIPRNYDDGKPASAQTRIVWLNRRAEHTETLAALATPELAVLLEKVGNLVGGSKGWTSIGLFTSQDGEKCRALAARIRQALETNSGD